MLATCCNLNSCNLHCILIIGRDCRQNFLTGQRNSAFLKMIIWIECYGQVLWHQLECLEQTKELNFHWRQSVSFFPFGLSLQFRCNPHSGVLSTTGSSNMGDAVDLDNQNTLFRQELWSFIYILPESKRLRDKVNQLKAKAIGGARLLSFQ